ncbi:hypothetical protein DQ244_05450 [Blastococcus sp. TBT05-19]|uniref:hypothetical protein n=1 Tax=Blastococcus sp. TBT05-19 TaxID=2250581 RepID=UPI000DE90FE2|nr:hypothetical protein [Blastococcus sp. TBT05-19]RBY94720.1 hypothetical protein DQ244_05450 [Blastococcus sp. TBT05-19]
MLLLGLLALGSLRLASAATAPTAGTSAVSLVDDAGGAALFSSDGLRPGGVESACVGLTARGSVHPATEVSLAANVTSGGLSPYLRVWVERGSVPAGGTCGAFTGAVIWNGTLDSFPATGTSGIATGWRPAVTERSVYRFTVSVLDDSRAAGLSTSATFRWAFTEAAPPPPTPPPPSPTTPPTVVLPPTTRAPQVTDVPTSARATDTTARAAPSTSAAPAVVTTEAVPSTSPSTSPSVPLSSAPVPPADGGSRRVVEAPPLESGAAAAVQAALAEAGQVAADVARTVEAVAQDGQYPLALVGVVAAFLFLQGRLDRRDPKLAFARVREELSEYRDFPGPPPTETT